MAPTSTLAGAVLRIFDLFADCYEKSPDCDLTSAIGDEGRDCTAAVRVNGISRPRFGRVFRFKQPSAFTDFHADDAFLFRGTELIRWFPSIEINKSARAGPRSLANTKSVIAVAANLWRESLICQDRVGFPFD